MSKKELGKTEERLFDLFLHDLFHIDEVRLALYSEGVCENEEERVEIEGHLRQCRCCQARFKGMEEVDGPMVQELEPPRGSEREMRSMHIAEGSVGEQLHHEDEPDALRLRYAAQTGLGGVPIRAADAEPSCGPIIPGFADASLPTIEWAGREASISTNAEGSVFIILEGTRPFATTATRELSLPSRLRVYQEEYVLARVEAEAVTVLEVEELALSTLRAAFSESSRNVELFCV
jgi:hypothetical protein